jgi:hypothetical protein
MGRASHPKKEVEAALQYAEEAGWRVEVGGSHAWGRIYCPFKARTTFADVASFASRRCGVRRRTQATMAKQSSV